jgi:hypothetical protein
MKNLILGAATAAAAMTFLAGPASAQDASAMMAAMFPDPNGDGVTTKDEMLAGAAARFDKLDADKDGKLSAAEIGSAPGARMLQRADTDNDGMVSKDEMAAATATRFDRMDANHDGKIDAAEREALMQRMQQMRPNN